MRLNSDTSFPKKTAPGPYIEISGRKGFGVKADDLMDLMISAAKSEVVKRHADWDDERHHRCRVERSPIGALRYYMLRFTPQFASSPSIRTWLFRRKARPAPISCMPPRAFAASSARETPRRKRSWRSLRSWTAAKLAMCLSGEENEDIWALWLRAGRRTMVLDQCIATSEPAYLAKHAFQLAQEFSNFYHHHHILTEEDPARKTFLLATAAVALRELVTVLGWLGIDSPEAM